ncbi:DUF1643 domain-containing protein [Eubacteriales bacterium OttesenSCG-928-G02]|nr:DUF1643 domain-containing protein [Eubacteriales bacterium OttesenSCG-928-G02]
MEKATIQIESVFDENKSHRYALKKVWNDTLKQAAVISIAPSSDSGVSSDLTCQLIQNNLNQLEFGGFVLTNLFSAIDCDFKKLKTIDGLFNKSTDKIILDSCAKADIIIVCWGAVVNKSKAIAKRAEDVIKLITKHASKIHFLSDGERAELHPLTPSLRHRWELVGATFTKDVPIGSWNGSIEIAE